MDLSIALKTRIHEIIEQSNISLTALCLNSNLTPSTVFDFMSGKSKFLGIVTIKKLCVGAGITLEEFFARDYFNSTDDVYK